MRKVRPYFGFRSVSSEVTSRIIASETPLTTITMSNTLETNTRFAFLQKQISRKLEARTLMLKSRISLQQFNHITTSDVPFPLSLTRNIQALDTLVDIEDFRDLASPEIHGVLIWPENFETLINNTFIPTLEQQKNPRVDIPDDYINLI
ncbi:hypothetical protein KGF57_003943 [Candida theae]|uniref:Uncharacterized protein n=1 Tax=Candida theae TaxID=1198502 RepID=A0AAD5FXD5_9ASCO|nr:uncharacterized protein KGF57_003943 [Candida theae]KAI5953734.1 hypothetical protein KGF57_003943 [Candida theae]